MHTLELARGTDVPGAVTVLVIEQDNKIRMPRQMVERALDQLLDGLFRRQSREVEFALLGADFLIYPFKHGEIQRVLVAEIMIHQLLVDAGAQRNLIDSCAREAIPGEFTPCRGQELAAGGDGIAPLRLFAIRS